MKDPVKNSIKVLTRTYYYYQNERIVLDNRLGMKKDGEIKKNVPERDEETLQLLYMRKEEVEELEKGFQKDIAKKIHGHPLWENFLKDVKGVGEVIAAVIISEIDIKRADTVSKLWAFSGVATGMTCGKKYNKKKKEIVITEDKVKRDKKTKGYLCPYNQFLKSKLLGVLGSSFLRCNSPYRTFYDNMKHRLASKNWGEISKNPVDKKNPRAGHQHNASIRKMIKMFEKDLYVAWRTLEGLPVRKPYQEEYLGHKHEK